MPRLSTNSGDGEIMSEEQPVENTDVVDHRMPKKNRQILVVGLILVIALAGFFGVKSGLIAPTVGNSLDDQLTRQFIPLAGQNSSVSCPPNAKFYAGATIICDVSTVAWNSALPNLKYVQVVVITHDIFHAYPVNG